MGGTDGPSDYVIATPSDVWDAEPGVARLGSVVELSSWRRMSLLSGIGTRVTVTTATSRRTLYSLLLAVTSTAPAMLAAQTPAVQQAIIIENDDRAGPRVGAAYLVGGSVTADRAHRPVSPFITLFGWQIEHQFDAGPGLPTPVTELVFLAGGMEQGVVLPSASWLLGLRQRNGWEFGAGPTLTGAGVQLAFAGGVTQAMGSLNVPVNLAVAPGRKGASISLTTGFNVRH